MNKKEAKRVIRKGMGETVDILTEWKRSIDRLTVAVLLLAAVAVAASFLATAV